MAAATLSLNGTQEKVWGGTEAQNAGQADDHKVNGARGQSRGGAEPSAAANNGILKGGEEMWCGWRAKRLKDKHDVGDTHTLAHMSSHTHTRTQSANAHGVCVITFCVTFAFYCIPQGDFACSLSPLCRIPA